ncbi:MAG: hypothetical protein LUH07_13235, partial [Lachnospiraceae bacterium]|nr:hypothetical protein [Lachnospiraceae bacterium]
MTAERKTAAAVLCACAVLCGGCGMINKEQAEWTPQESDAISIASDGSVTEIVQETLDQSYYD